jgi:hypothetical protein
MTEPPSWCLLRLTWNSSNVCKGATLLFRYATPALMVRAKRGLDTLEIPTGKRARSRGEPTSVSPAQRMATFIEDGPDEPMNRGVLGRHSIDKGRPVVYGLPHRRRCFGKKS